MTFRKNRKNVSTTICSHFSWKSQTCVKKIFTLLVTNLKNVSEKMFTLLVTFLIFSLFYPSDFIIDHLILHHFSNNSISWPLWYSFLAHFSQKSQRCVNKTVYTSRDFFIVSCFISFFSKLSVHFFARLICLTFFHKYPQLSSQISLKFA